MSKLTLIGLTASSIMLLCFAFLIGMPAAVLIVACSLFLCAVVMASKLALDTFKNGSDYEKKMLRRNFAKTLLIVGFAIGGLMLIFSLFDLLGELLA